MLGTLINVGMILLGVALGLGLRRGIPERLRDTVMQGLALCVILIGLKGAFGVDGAVIQPVDTLCVIVCMALGGILGSAIDIETRLDHLGKRIEARFASGGDGQISRAFVSTSLLYCVGAMAIVGAIDSGIRGDHATLIAKGIIDGVTAIFFTSAMGWGVALSAVAVLVYQGAIALLATLLAPLLTAEIIAAMGSVGGLLVAGVGLNMLRDKHIAVGNLLPAIFLPAVYIPLSKLFGA